MTRSRRIAIALGTRSLLVAGWTALHACATVATRPAPDAPPPGADAASPGPRVSRDDGVATPGPDAPVEGQQEPDRAGAPEAHGATAPASLPELGDVRRLQARYDIPLDVNEEVVACVRLFQSPELRPVVVQWLSRLQRYGPRYREILREHGVPQDTVFLAMIESGFTRRARSRARAVGPWQFIASTARRYGLRYDAWVDERRDPEKAATAAARFLRALYRETGDWRLAWAGYNAGPGRVRRARELGYLDFWEMARAPGALPAETRAYVPRIMAAAIVAKHAEALGFRPEEIPSSRWVEYEEVVVARSTPLSALARAAGVDVGLLRDLNVELLRPHTPPRVYRLKVPIGKSRVVANAARLFRTPREITRHRVERGDTIVAIARRFGVTPRDLLAANAVSPRRLRPGTLLVVPLGAATAGAAATTGGPSRVRVSRGDTLWSIARRAGITVRDLARWNDIQDPRRHVLLPGRVLTLSAVTSRPPRSPIDEG